MSIVPISVYKNRRNKLIQMLARDGFCSGAILLIAGFEDEKNRFIQESFFWYLTGINEPGVVMLIDFDSAQTVLFVPNFEIQRRLWSINYIDVIVHSLSEWGVDRIEFLGLPHPGYSIIPFFSSDQYKILTEHIQKIVAREKVIYTINPSSENMLFHQHIVLSGLKKESDLLEHCLKDLSSYLIKMRRIKDDHEIEAIFNAVDITTQAQQAAASIIAHGQTEAEVQAAAQYIIVGSGADCAFPSIIASGTFSTVLHYTANSNRLAHDACVLVDIGAQKNHYCADLARTYPISGKFSARHKELYQIVLDAHLHILEYAKPEFFLNNKRYQDRSLQHIAKAYFKKYGYEDYFNHGIGHMLGLDVHDCNDPQMPLEVGVVFTIEPGIYLTKEAIGIRIEDNYWLTEKGPICLSDHLIREVIDVEKLMVKTDQ